MASLYQIDAAIASWEPEVDENGEVLNISALEELEMNRQLKLENIACYIKNLRSDAVEIKNEEQKLKERREAIERKADRLCEYLSNSLNGEKLNSPRCAVSWRESESVNITNEELIPREYMTEKVEVKPNKVLLKKLLKEDHKIAGCELVKSNNIQIK